MAMTRAQYDSLHNSKVNQSLNTKGYRVVLTPHFEKREDMTTEELANIDRLNSPIEFDVVNDHDVDSSSTITTQPLVNGDTVADHMIREALTLNLSGIFSLYGNKPTRFPGGENRLTNIEKFFEKIKNEGIFCSIVMMSRDKSNNQRFKVRDSLVLNRVHWKYSQASVNYTFNFTEIITVDVDIPEKDYTDENLPAITDATPLNFTDTLLDVDDVLAIAIKKLEELNLLSNGFLNYVVSTFTDGLLGTAITGAAVGALAIAIGSWIAGGLLAIGPAGWAVIGVIAAIGAVVGMIVGIYKGMTRRIAEKEFGVKAFEYYKDDLKNKQEVERFADYTSTISENLNYLNEYMQVYGIGSSEAQECMLYVDDTYYIFTFTKLNVATVGEKIVWLCHVENIDGTLKKDFNLTDASFSNLSECKSSNCLFRASNGSYVYFVNNKLYSVENRTYNNSDERYKAITECKSDLKSYYILATKIKMEDFQNKLKEAVIDAMKM